MNSVFGIAAALAALIGLVSGVGLIVLALRKEK
jgi:hypothetical protein